jgi:hypothetical protein
MIVRISGRVVSMGLAMWLALAGGALAQTLPPPQPFLKVQASLVTAPLTRPARLARLPVG